MVHGVLLHLKMRYISSGSGTFEVVEVFACSLSGREFV